MCFVITSGPEVVPPKLALPGSADVELSVRCIPTGMVTVTCRSTLLDREVSTRVKVVNSADISIPLELRGVGHGVHNIDVEVSQPGCQPDTRVASFTAV